MGELGQDPELLEAFFEEATDLVRELEHCLLALEDAPGRSDLIDQSFRCAHTLKGNSAMLGFASVTELSHGVESVLERVRAGELAAEHAAIDPLLAAIDVLNELLASARTGELNDEARARAEALQARLAAATSAATGTSAPTDASPRSTAPETPSPTPPVPKADEAPRGAPPAAPAPASSSTWQHGETSSIRVSLEKIDDLVNLAGELAITQSMLSQLTSTAVSDTTLALSEAVVDMARNVRELQERVMAVRMLPLRMVLSGMPRLVRDVAQTRGKRIVLLIDGEDTELDKSVIENVADPLGHLVRNAADHGIERPEARLARGKPAHGTIALHARQEGGRIVIEISDDGQGLDRDRILARAVERGLIAEGETLSDEQIFALIFVPGFSTAEQVTDVSGRGVGMDVVRRNITAIGGTIVTSSTPGEGTRFRIVLPLTLAILDGQLIRVGSQAYVVPLVNIVELVRLDAGELRELPGGATVVNLRGELLPMVDLRALLGDTDADANGGLLAIVEGDRGKVAMLADGLLEQQQVVIKSLETNFHRIEGLAGATILGDGRVALILDVAGLVGLARRRAAEASPAQARAEAAGNRPAPPEMSA